MDEALQIARHDLGKYIALQSRWLPEDASTEEIRAALVADLRGTRRSGAIQEDAWQVWERLRPELRAYPLHSLDLLMGKIREGLPLLETLPRKKLLELVEAAREVGPALSACARAGRGSVG